MYNPAQTVAVVKELVERQGVFAFVGGVSAAGGLAVKDYLAQNKVSPSSTRPRCPTSPRTR